MSTNISTASLAAMPIVMRLNRTWDVKLPPAKKRILGGKLVPTVRGLGGRFAQKKRRLAIEIHGPSADKNEPELQTEAPKRRGLTRAAGALQTVDLAKELMDDDRILVRIFKPRKQWGFSRDPDDSSDSDDDNSIIPDSHKEDDAWVEYRKYALDEIVDMELSKTVFEATMGLGANQERREIRFEHDEQAKDFMNQLEQLKALTEKRAQLRLNTYHESQRKVQESINQVSQRLQDTSTARSIDNLSPASDVNLLIEIVSAMDIPIADRSSTDPYVIVYMGRQELHRTKPIPKTVNPIWTVDTGSLFLLSTTAQEFFEASTGLTFVIKDHDKLTSNDVICRVNVEQAALLEMNGERIGLPLQLLESHKYKAASSHFEPKLFLRVRPATADDRTFMKQVFAVKNSKTRGVYADKTFIGPQKDRVRLLKKESKMVNGVKLYRVKPKPDPTRPDVTKWLDDKALVAEAMKPSYKWIEAGTGTLGKVYLEILKCEGLPNLDTSMEGKTDAFCCIIYEDAIVSTDVINDTLKPRWLPWSQRAFCFRMAHPSSQVLIGVFDFDTENGINAHDSVGRVSIDVTNFRRDTEYILTYDLHRSVLDNEPRQTFGSLTVRLRLEYDSYRDLVKGSLQLPPINYINLAQSSAFKTSYFVINGEENLERFDMDAITAYRTELEGYLDVMYYITQAFVTVMLWRSHCKVSLGKWKVELPIHSAIAFLMGISLVENLNLAPSYFFFSIAWLLLATNEYRQKNPSAWQQSMTYLQIWYAVLADKAPPVVIDAYENEAIIKSFNAENQKRKESRIAQAEEARQNAEKLNAFLSEETNSAAEAFDEDGTTKLGGAPELRPFANALLPIQKILGLVCKNLRIATSIVLWSESIYTFMVVNICLALGIALIWVPWSFFLRWTARLVVWACLGPWMKLVDIFYVQKQTESASEMLKRMAREKLQTVSQSRDIMMQHKEDIMKARAMRRFMFGRFVTRVPQFKEYRYPDCPLAESSAKPIEASRQVEIERRSHGQTLVGHMIPLWGDAVDTVMLEEKQKTEEVEKNDEKEDAITMTKADEEYS